VFPPISRAVRPFPAPTTRINGDSSVACADMFSGVPNVGVIMVLLGAPGLLHAHFSDIAASRITT
jgi:hypothetical protein